MQIKNDLDKILEIIPLKFSEILRDHPDKHNLIEIIFDLGCIPEARFLKKSIFFSDHVVTQQDLDYCLGFLKSFNEDNRTGITKTLHRISCIRNRNGQIIGLTCRVGRAFFGKINIIRDLLDSNKSILFLGRPGIGKTTLIREISNIFSSEILKRVIIIDSSNEIAGDNDIPDLIVGKSRRMQVSDTSLQHKIMIEAVENHTPEVIIIDEIGTELEAFAAQTIAERGVQLIATAHAHSLLSVLKNPVLSNLIGGVDYVTLGDEEAKRRNVKKTIIERKGLPTFSIVIELNTDFSWVIYEDIELAIDNYLDYFNYKAQIRSFNNKRKTIFSLKSLTFDSFISKNSNLLGLNSNSLASTNLQTNKAKVLKFKLSLVVYTYSFFISNDLINMYCKFFDCDFIFTKNIFDANIIVGLKSHLKNNKVILEYSRKNCIPIYYFNNRNDILLKSFFAEILEINTIKSL